MTSQVHASSQHSRLTPVSAVSTAFAVRSEFISSPLVLVQVDRNRPEAVPFDRPADHEVERIRAAIERKKRIENERDTRRANGRND